jgi:tRNA threonylcarbamoyl adenosine modification protein YeaZ
MASITVLALDTSSVEVSVAVATGGDLRSLITLAKRRSSGELLAAIDEALHAAGTALPRLDGVVALRGPGSFTGLRVGLATVLGFHQALGVPATGVSTLEVLACSVPPGPSTLAVVHALAGSWFGQQFAGDPPVPLAPAERLELRARLAHLGVDRCVGHGLEPVADALADAGIAALAPIEPLAAVAARHFSRQAPAWEPETLTTPLYLAPAPATLPGAPKPVLSATSRAH